MIRVEIVVRRVARVGRGERAQAIVHPESAPNARWRCGETVFARRAGTEAPWK